MRTRSGIYHCFRIMRRTWPERVPVGQPGSGRYNVRVINAGTSKEKLESTWLGMGLTAALMQINPPGFVSGPSQSSEVTYSQPSDNASHQSQMRLLLRDLSRAHDVQQGMPVAKRFENMPKLLSEEVLNQIGLLNHPTWFWNNSVHLWLRIKIKGCWKCQVRIVNGRIKWIGRRREITEWWMTNYST